jgi:hypothetical protein
VGFDLSPSPKREGNFKESDMKGDEMKRLYDAMEAIGYSVKKVEMETYEYFDKPKTGEKYTGEFYVKLRPLSAEIAELQKANEVLAAGKQESSQALPGGL